MRVYRIVNEPAPDGCDLIVTDTGWTHAMLRHVMVSASDGISAVKGESPDFVSTGTFEALRNQPDFSDYAVYLRTYDPATYRIRNFGIGLHKLANVMLHTMSTRQRLEDFLHNSGNLRVLFAVVVPFADAPVAEWAIVIPGTAENTRIKGGEVTDVVWWAGVDARIQPSMSFQTATRENTFIQVTYEVKTATGALATDYAPVVFFETTAGRLLATRTTARSGIATCVVDVADLPAGAPIKIKAGFKYFPGMADYVCEA